MDNPFAPDFTGLTEEKDYTALFRSSILDQTKDYPKPVPVINLIQDGETFPLLTKKSFSLWQGKQKSKKTTALALAIAAFIGKSNCEDSTRFEAAEKGIALFCDCEQGESYAAQTMHLILNLSGSETNENLIYCDLREFSPSERMEIIKAAARAVPEIKIIVADGIVDLMVDFMDAKEGHTTVTDLLRLTSELNIHIAGVLHQNKGASKDARAHVGSISSQKCEREIMVEVDPDDRAQSIVNCKESRGLPFENFAIRWDKGSLPCIVQNWQPLAKTATGKPKTLLCTEIAKETHIQILEKVFSVEPSKKYAELLLSLQNEIDSWYTCSISEAKVKKYIQYYVDQKLLIKVGKTPHTKYSIYGT